jgi:hypothetical protein
MYQLCNCAAVQLVPRTSNPTAVVGEYREICYFLQTLCLITLQFKTVDISESFESDFFVFFFFCFCFVLGVGEKEQVGKEVNWFKMKRHFLNSSIYKNVIN